MLTPADETGNAESRIANSDEAVRAVLNFAIRYS
jgi:hypothetical protein